MRSELHPRRRAIVLLALSSLLVWACGSTASPPAPAGSPSAGAVGSPSAAAPSPAGTAGPAVASPAVASPAVASPAVSPAATPAGSAQGHLDPGLEAMLPGVMQGTTLSKASGSGADVFQNDPFSTQMRAFLSSVGKTPADFHFAQAWDPAQSLEAEIGAFRTAGVDGATLLKAIVDASQPGSVGGLKVSTATISGKPVTIAASAAGTTLYLYPTGETVLYVGTPDENLATTVIATFP
jgi:hypothetical protein